MQGITILIYLVLGCSILPCEPKGSPLQPITLPPSTIDGSQNCSNISQLLQTISQSVSNIIALQVANNLSCILNGTPNGLGPLCPASSCKAIAAALPNNTSGYYWIRPSSTNTSVQVYCDLTRYLNGSRGWMRVAYLNMSASNQSCPSNWTAYPAGPYVMCGKPGGSACYSNYYSTYGVPYSRICGWAVGYNYLTNDAFARYGSCCPSPCPIDGVYVDGISITHSSNPRQHIWSYAAAQISGNQCPCYTGTGTSSVPSYVGSNWYCGGQPTGTGTNGVTNYYNYPLWNNTAVSCTGSLAPCCANLKQPWFYRTLNVTITNSIEVRLCSDEPLSNEDIRVINLELYVY